MCRESACYNCYQKSAGGNRYRQTIENQNTRLAILRFGDGQQFLFRENKFCKARPEDLLPFPLHNQRLMCGIFTVVVHIHHKIEFKM
jgi:hypothetical protein